MASADGSSVNALGDETRVAVSCVDSRSSSSRPSRPVHAGIACPQALFGPDLGSGVESGDYLDDIKDAIRGAIQDATADATADLGSSGSRSSRPVHAGIARP